MAPDEAAEELAENDEKKQDAVLEREGFEQEIMQDDESDIGEQVDDVEEGE